MADMLSTGVSGLLAFQRALDTTGHNIANASTDGYNRQLVNLGTRNPTAFGNGWVGNGVDVTTVRRMYDEALATQQRSAGNMLQQMDTFASYAERINNLFSDSGTGLANTLQQFSSAIETLSNSPGSATARQVMISQAQTLVQRLKSYNDNLGALDAQLGTQLRSEAATVTTLARNIADLNEQVIRAQGINQQPPNDLLDQRDRLIAELSQHVGITTLQQDNGAINIFIGSGQALVTNNTAATLAVAPGQYDNQTQRLLLQSSGASIDVTDALGGGTIGGALQFRTDMLAPAQRALGLIGVTMGTLVNQQQAAGLDLTGQFGTPLFAVGAIRVLGSVDNTGSAAVTATRSNLAALTAEDLQLRFNGTAWSAYRPGSGAAVAMSGAGTVGNPFIVDGLSIVLSGTAAAGDSFVVQPTHDAIAGMSVVLSDPSRIAAAAPLVTAASATNTGNGTINAGTVTNPGGWVRGSYTLSFTSGTAYQVVNAGNTVVASGTYTSGAPISFNGMQVAVSGTPAAGDSFSIADNSSGSGDNRNLRALTALLDAPSLNGGTMSLSDAVGRFIGDIGVKTNQAQVGRDAQSVVLDNATMAMQEVSGVNLDEEAANLVRFQQAYQAAAQVIAAANAMFDTLLEATRR